MSADPTCTLCPKCSRRPIDRWRKVTLDGVILPSCEACYRTEYRSGRPTPPRPRLVRMPSVAPRSSPEPKVRIAWWDRPRRQPRLDKSRGYLKITIPVDHPLFRPSSRSTGAHRVILFDCIGYGPHRCHWCGSHVNWRAGLVVDHLDDIKTNNDSENLVPACMPCNTGRGRLRDVSDHVTDT